MLRRKSVCSLGSRTAYSFAGEQVNLAEFLPPHILCRLTLLPPLVFNLRCVLCLCKLAVYVNPARPAQVRAMLVLIIHYPPLAGSVELPTSSGRLDLTTYCSATPFRDVRHKSNFALPLSLMELIPSKKLTLFAGTLVAKHRFVNR